MTKEKSSTQLCQDESSVDVFDASHSSVSNATFGNFPKYVAEDGSRRNMTKVKSGTRRSQGLMLLLAFLIMYSLLQEKNILHSVKTSLELDFEKATGDTDVFPTVAPYPTSLSTSSKVGMSVSGQDQAETEIATSKVELERQDASAEKEAERNNQKENEKELEDSGQAATEVANSRLELQRQDALAEEDALVISEGPIEDDRHIKAQSLEMENIATSDTTTHPLARQIQTDITTSVTATNMTTTPRPCRVAVTNSRVAFHYETLESIASLFPLDAINFSLSQLHEQQCDPKNIQFDYYVFRARGSPRAKEWGESYRKRLMGRRVSMPQKDNVTRRFGELHMQTHSINELSRSKYLFDATIEATCYCTKSQLKWLMAETRSCVFHARCDAEVANPRAVWLSPHHEKYYIPTALPGALQSQQQQKKRPLQKAKRNTPHKLCVIGSTDRRDWGSLAGYLESTLGAKAAASSRFIIQIAGKGDFPQELKGHRHMTIREKLPNDSKFYQVVRRCEAVLLLINKTKQLSYFDTADSPLKLSGAIPIVIAYQLPVLIHEELYDLYQDHLSSVIHATHSDNATSFNAAMNQLLDALDGNDNKSANMTVPPFSSPEQ
jgi:hypothetical protein